MSIFPPTINKSINCMKKKNKPLFTKLMFAGLSTLFLSTEMLHANPVAGDSGSVGWYDVGASSSQQVKVTVQGVVADALGAVAGVNVAEKGTANGTITNADGKFSLNVSANAMLVFSFIGYAEQQVAVKGQSFLSVELKEDMLVIDEVVVVGYGTQKKANLTGSVASVNFAEQSMSRPITTVSSALAGLSAGVAVMQGSGQPGSDGASIVIRGTGSLNDASPLVLIDGMQGVMDAVSPMDIESISILKDAASAAIYGSRAAHGVILITTKRGAKDRVNVNYTGRISFSRPSNLIDQVTDYADYMEWMNESFTNIGQNVHFSPSTIDLWREKTKDPNRLNENGVPNYVAYPNTDWQKELFGNGLIHDHNVSMNGGNAKMHFLISSGYLDNQGLVENTSMKKYSLRANIEANPTEWLKLGTRTFASMEDKDPGNFGDANNFLRQTTPGLYPRWNGKSGGPEAPEESATANSLYTFLNNRAGQLKKTRFNTTLFSQVTFMKGLSWDFNLNFQRRWDEDRTWTDGASAEKVRFSDGKVLSPHTDPSLMSTSFNNYSNWNYTLENILRYNTMIAADHDISALAGYSEYYYYEYSTSGSKRGLIDQSINVPGSATEMLSIGGSAADRASRSFFGRVNYAYKSRYLLEANYRYDGHSRFHQDHRWGGFPGFSAGWRISEEGFMESTRHILDNLKVRASWGQLGNAGGDGVGDYEYQATYGSTNYSLGGTQSQGLASTAIANSLLTWESVTTTNIGVDAMLLKNRLTVEVDLYNKMTDGILYRPNIYYTMGSVTAPRLNIAELTNRGVELTASWRDRVGEVSYSVSANLNYNQNKVTKYKGEYKAGWTVDSNGKRVWSSNIGEVSNGGTTRILEGKIKDEFYIMDVYKGNGSRFNTDGTPNINGGPKDGIIRTPQDMEWLEAMIAEGYKFMPNQTIGKSKIWYGDPIFADANGDGIYGSADDYQFRNYSKAAKYNFGFQMGAAWKGFDLSLNWAGAAGRKIYWGSTTGYNTSAMRVGLALGTEVANNHYFYDPENPDDLRTNINAKYPRLVNGESGFQGTTGNTTMYLYNGDYLKLKNLTVGYTLPRPAAKAVHAEAVRAYFSGENLLTISSFPGQDPELDSAATYTSVRQFAFGVNVTF
ncbi:Outer membrane receptor for ferrienterochelin and colicins [Bacteroidales bacterium Barb6XT]|nr:Outer membrane receptor for ferrienterochelin and colicins [Bacteroidales bacterium Barb6XT]